MLHSGLSMPLVGKTEWDIKWAFLPGLHAKVQEGVDVSEGEGHTSRLPRVRNPLNQMLRGDSHYGAHRRIAFANGAMVSVCRVRAPPGVERVREAVAKLRSLMQEKGGSEEPSFNEAEGEYLQLGLRGFPGTRRMATHRVVGPAVTPDIGDYKDGVCGELTAWMHPNMDLDLESVGIVFHYLVQVHKHGIKFVRAHGQEQTAHDFRAVTPVGLAAIFLKVNPGLVHAPFSLVLRGCTDWLPAHVDPDVSMLTPHYYVAGAGKSRRVPAAGCAVFVGSERLGGQVAEVDTDAQEGDLLIVGFNPTKQLHWVDSRGGAAVDKTGLRVIPYNPSWACEKVLKAMTDPYAPHAYVRLAPLNPKNRNPIRCTYCKRFVGCPTIHPKEWVEHFGCAVQAAAGRRFECISCCETRLKAYP
jgi:hypothetical protein